MATNQYRREAFGGLRGTPFRVSSINTQDSGYVTDLVQNMTLDVPAKPCLTPSRKQSKQNKIHKCRICPVDKRFGTKNDLIRHMKTCHGLLRKGDKVWLCPVQDCTSAGKRWPRFDNFRQHVLKQHGEEHMDKLEQAFETITIEQLGGKKSSSPKQYTGQAQASTSTIDPRLLDDTSDLSSEQDTTSVTFDHDVHSPRDHVVTRYSPTNSSRGTPRSAQSYPFRPALTAAAKAFNRRLFPLCSGSPSSAPSQRVQPQPEIPSPTLLVFDYPPNDDRAGYDSSYQTAPIEEIGTGEDSFLEYYDTHVRSPPTRSADELTAVGTSFNDCSAPSLTNTGSTRTSVDQLDDLQQNMQSISLPSADFEMIPGSNPLLSTRNSDPIPQLRITTANSCNVRSSPACCLQNSDTPNRLLPHKWHPCYSPETMLSSMSDGETSFVFYDATHDPDARPDSAISRFVEELALLVLEAYRNYTPSSSAETTRPGTGTGTGQENSSSRRPTQSSGGADNPRKRKASRIPDRRRQSHGDHEDEEEDDQNSGGNSDNKRARTGHGDVLLACPFYKNDPLNHPHCANLVLRSIPALKQHLHRKHRRPENYCPRCFDHFPTPEGLLQHQRQDDHCDVVIQDPYVSLMTAAACQQIQRRNPGTPENVWYEIYGILFPNTRRPPSPFLDDQASVLHVSNIFRGFGPIALQWLIAMRRSIPAVSQAIYEQALQEVIDLYNQNPSQLPRRHLVPTGQAPGTLTPESLPISLPNIPPPPPMQQMNPHAEMPLFGMGVPTNNVLTMNEYQQQYNAQTMQADDLDPNIVNAGGWMNFFNDGTM